MEKDKIFYLGAMLWIGKPLTTPRAFWLTPWVYAILATERQGHLYLGTKSVCWQFGVSLCFVNIAHPRLYMVWSLHSACNPIVIILIGLHLTPFASLLIEWNMWFEPFNLVWESLCSVTSRIVCLMVYTWRLPWHQAVSHMTPPISHSIIKLLSTLPIWNTCPYLHLTAGKLRRAGM